MSAIILDAGLVCAVFMELVESAAFFFESSNGNTLSSRTPASPSSAQLKVPAASGPLSKRNTAEAFPSSSSQSVQGSVAKTEGPNVLFQVQAMHPYTARNDTELTLEVGRWYKVLQTEPTNQWHFLPSSINCHCITPCVGTKPPCKVAWDGSPCSA